MERVFGITFDTVIFIMRNDTIGNGIKGFIIKNL